MSYGPFSYRARIIRGYDTGEKRGRSLLELGCGTGIVGISASMLGFSPALLTDSEDFRATVEKNIQDSGLNLEQVKFAQLDWTKPESYKVLDITHIKWDLIVLADVLYLESQIDDLLNVVKLLIAHNPNSEIILAYPERQIHATHKVFDALKLVGLNSTLVATSCLDSRVKVYLLTRACCLKHICGHDCDWRYILICCLERHILPSYNSDQITQENWILCKPC